MEPLKCPHYAGKKLRGVTQHGNRGLFFAKFFDQWNSEFTKIAEPEPDRDRKIDYHGGKMNWVLSQFHDRPPGKSGRFKVKDPERGGGRKVGNAAEIAAAVQRLCDLALALNRDDPRPGPLCLVTTGPFVTGMGLAHPLENGFLWHHTLGIPYLPGPSVKGMIRAWAEHWEDDMKTVDRLFGRDDAHADGPAAGALIVFDALPTAPVSLMAEVITPHDDGWRINEAATPSDWNNPNPIPFLAVAPGAQFQFAVARRHNAEANDLETAYDYLEAALEWIGAGAKTGIGFGRMVSDEAMAAMEERQEVLRQAEMQRELAQRIEARQSYPIGTRVRFDGINWELTEPHRLGSGQRVRLFETSEGSASVEEDEIDEWDVQG
ncbi:type III-B CRISPR module RAMP protein Cmr6 [Pelagibius sp. CAU 1746]|uniref:type III-B CRISPR module RAMP protein Cmr6 n=1 Tax=Pelagibius sp. CAU 1746 TaxID=3140370 RepID=UPI00325AF0A2